MPPTPCVPNSTRPHAFSSGAAGVALALASSLLSVDARAEQPPASRSHQAPGGNPDLARSVAITGREAFNTGAYETALALFRRAYTLFPAPTVVLYEARTLEKMGLLLEAVEAYRRTTQMPVDAHSPTQFAEAIAVAEQEAREVQASIPSLTVDLDGTRGDAPELRVLVNDHPIDPARLGQAQKRNPGRYRVSGSLGEQTDQKEVLLKRGQHLTVVLDLPGAAFSSDLADSSLGVASAASTERGSVPIWAYAAGGVGVLGIGSGLVTGLMAGGKHAAAERGCPDSQCAPGSPGSEAADAFRTLRMVSSISYGVGVVGVAAGLVLWLNAADDEETQGLGRIEPWGNANTAGIRGTF